MANFNTNEVRIGGRITNDLELKVTPGGTSVLNFSVAVNKGKGDNKTSIFFNCTAWKKVAEDISKYFRKGNSIYIKDAEYTPDVVTGEDGKKTVYPKFTVYKYAFVDSRAEVEEMEASGEINSVEPNPYATDAPQFEEIADEELPF